MAEVYSGEGVEATANGDNWTAIMQTEENNDITREAAEVDQSNDALAAAPDDATIVTSIPVVDVTLVVENFEMTIPEEFLYMLESSTNNQTKEKVVDIKFLTKLLELKHYVLKSQQFLDVAVDKIILQQVRIKRKPKRKKKKDPPQEEIEIRENEGECSDNGGGVEVVQQQHEAEKENEALIEGGNEGDREELVTSIADVVAESTKEQESDTELNESNLPEEMDSDSDSDSTASESSRDASSAAAVIMPESNYSETDYEEEEITMKNRRKKAKQPSPSVHKSRSRTSKNGKADNKRKRRTEEEIITTPRQKRPRACRKDSNDENIFDLVEETPAAQRRKARKSGITTRKSGSGGKKEKVPAKGKKKKQSTPRSAPRKKNVKPKVAPAQDDEASEAESYKDDSDSDDASAVVVKETIDTHSHGQAKKWANCLLQMKEFYDKHGHYNVPSDKPEFKTLKTWHTTTCDMGRKYMKGKLPQWKEKFEIVNQQLEDFNWGAIKGTPTSNLYDTSIPWDDYYEMLKEYKEKFGHPNVPLTEVKHEHSNLAGWVSDMRAAGNRILKIKGTTSVILTPDRFAKLDALGFSWRRKDDRWLEKYERLKQYKEEHGDCLVPKVYPKDKTLGTWVSEMRKCGRRHLAGQKNGSVTEERFKLLDEIGFCWYIPGKKYPN